MTIDLTAYYSSIAIAASVIVFGLLVLRAFFRFIRKTITEAVAESMSTQMDFLNELQHQQSLAQHQTAQQLSNFHLENHKLITESILKHMTDVREQISHSFKEYTEALTGYLKNLTEELRHHLHQLTHQVNHRLNEGFDKTSVTFNSVIQRLTIIDEAQKKITELSSHVVNLQDILTDKRSRGAFGEVQLTHLISNIIPKTHYQLQATLSNQKRADCLLLLPPPTGNIVIDAKFPLETYQLMMNTEAGSYERKQHQQQFKQDIQKHIKDISQKYIIPNETSDSALMFIPAEAIFAEIHANHPDLVALSQKHRVWLVSPSTLMAVLTTAKAVLKDDATKTQVHIIQKHLGALSEDFMRFEKRMEKLSKHIDLAHQDVNEVNTSAKKITQRFQKIESVELDLHDALPLKTPVIESAEELL